MRPNFSVTLRGPSEWNNMSPDVWNSSTVDTAFCSEQTWGTTRRKPAGKFIPPLAYAFQRVKQDRGSGTLDVKYTNRYNGTNDAFAFRTRGSLFHNGTSGGIWNLEDLIPLADQGPSFAMEQEALIDARLGMKKGDLNLGVAFAERNQTARLVGDTALKLVKSARNLKKGRWKQAARDLGITNPKRPRGASLTERWLEYQYGWKPLLGDVFSSVDALTKRDKYDWLVTSKAARKEIIKRHQTVESQYFFADAVASGWKGCFCRIDALPENDLALAMASLGVTNPALIGWELLPFSFIVDWFLPVGDFLESLDAMLGYGETYFSMSYFYRYEMTVTLKDGSVPLRNGWGIPDWNIHWDPKANASPCKIEKVRLDRSAGTDVPLPRMPAIKDPRSLAHMANALSLLAQTFR